MPQLLFILIRRKEGRPRPSLRSTYLVCPYGHPVGSTLSLTLSTPLTPHHHHHLGRRRSGRRSPRPALAEGGGVQRGRGGGVRAPRLRGLGPLVQGGAGAGVGGRGGGFKEHYPSSGKDMMPWSGGGIQADGSYRPYLPSPQEMMTDPAGHPASRPLRRRAMLLVAQWVARLRAEDRPTAYHALVQTLGEGDRCLQVREHWSSPGGTQGGGARQRNHNLHTCVTHIADPSYVHCLN